MQRMWDRTKAEFIEVPVQVSPDASLSCRACRYFDNESNLCLGVGSTFYLRKIPFYNYTPRTNECEVRLPPDLFSFIEI